MSQNSSINIAVLNIFEGEKQMLMVLCSPDAVTPMMALTKAQLL